LAALSSTSKVLYGPHFSRTKFLGTDLQKASLPFSRGNFDLIASKQKLEVQEERSLSQKTDPPNGKYVQISGHPATLVWLFLDGMYSPKDTQWPTGHIAERLKALKPTGVNEKD
jgi:hypothetical protein